MLSEIFLFSTVSGFKILPAREHATTIIECGLRFFFVAVSGIKILPHREHASTVLAQTFVIGFKNLTSQ